MAKKYEFERLDIEATPHTRLGMAKRKKRIRSTHQRCPRCKKIRMKWGRANWHHAGRKRWEQRKEGLVCHICISRETQA